MKGFPIIVTKTGNPPAWLMSHHGGSASPITVPAKVSGDFTYNIVNGGGVTFAAQNPIWIKQGTAKPTAPVVDGQITNVAGGGTTTLKFTDLNSGNPVTLTYSLHFSDGTQIDPIIENQGGGPGLIGPDYSVYYIAGAVLLAAVLLVLLFRRRSAAPQRTESQRPTDINES